MKAERYMTQMREAVEDYDNGKITYPQVLLRINAICDAAYEAGYEAGRDDAFDEDVEFEAEFDLDEMRGEEEDE